MRLPFFFRWLTLGLVAAAASPAVPAASEGAVASGKYRNLFAEYLGKSPAETEAKITAAWRQLVAGDPATQRLVFPIGGDMAYIPDIVHRDVRTEGLSYGMMIAVQLNRREDFDRLWKFARTFMYHADGPRRGYFAWHTTYEGRPLDPGPAPDGEEWFTTALFFAAHRWGNGGGIFNYEAEAQAILRAMLHKHDEPARDGITDMFDRAARMVVFAPDGWAARFSDPSYHLPAFYPLWARWATAEEDRTFLATLAPTSRAYFKRAAHPRTGLMPDYATFDGTPVARDRHDLFEFDAWRTMANVALDHAWWAADAWEIEQSNRVLRFLEKQGPEAPNRFTLDGSPRSKTMSPGMHAMAAVAALAADREVGQPFVQRLWDAKLPEGDYRYYDGLLTMLALLEVSGQFRVY